MLMMLSIQATWFTIQNWKVICIPGLIHALLGCLWPLSHLLSGWGERRGDFRPQPMICQTTETIFDSKMAIDYPIMKTNIFQNLFFRSLITSGAMSHCSTIFGVILRYRPYQAEQLHQMITKLMNWQRSCLGSPQSILRLQWSHVWPRSSKVTWL